MKLLKYDLVSSVLSHIVFYPTPYNINYFWNFGSLAGLFLGLQILTGLFLSMHYCANTLFAFASVEHIMRDVNNGWLIRYMHSNGASFFFIAIYIHIGRNILYRSYFGNYFTWFVGILIFLISMATAFLGYVLPWGQMSFWGATVITNLFSAIPLVGTEVSYFLWGGFSVGNPTLNRFFSLHYLLPFVLLALVILHLLLLHENGSSAPVSLKYSDKIYFYPYFYLKDFFSLLVFFYFYFYLVILYPNLLGHPDNYIEANPLVTPAHIVPEWYFLPFYAILRSIPDKLTGVIYMFLSIVIFLFINFIEDSFLYLIDLFKIYYKKTSIMFSVDNIIDPKFSFLHQIKNLFFILVFLLLGWVGAMPAENPFVSIGLNLTIFFFFYVFIILPGLNIFEKYLVENFKNLN